MPITVNEIRAKFLAYMKEKGHAVVPSASLVPENDPTTLFTSSGMQPMLPYLLGEPHPLGKRITDSQKSFRSQDIEEVGDNRHTTFFEMLGNWSFGDYFKEEELRWMWTFLIDELHLDPQHFYVTCFAGNEALDVPRDTFSAEMWQKLFKEKGIDALISDTPEEGMKEGEKIFYYGEKKNWWSRSGVPSKMPEGEPGGPDSEMFYDFDPDLSKGVHEKSAWAHEACHVNCDCGRFVEIGNNVFMQYKKIYLPNGMAGFEELPQKNVDHGSGLERYAAALRNDSDIFNIDVFDEAKKTIAELSHTSYNDSATTTYAYRVILDHIRSATFLISDGVVPGNKDQMYFVRRLIRRAVRYARTIGVDENFTARVASSFIDVYKGEYKNLIEKKDFILSELDKEETKFRATLEKGMREFEKIALTTISGKDAFNLLQSFGFPIELTEELAKERGLTVDREGFEVLKATHAEESRTASVGKFKGGLADQSEVTTALHSTTHIMLAGMRKVLGNNVTQAGSNITPERIRFDFTLERKVEDDEIKQIEDFVNNAIESGFTVSVEDMPKQQAKEKGVTGAFWDKYPDIVKVYTMKNESTGEVYSQELCGGPHVEKSDTYLKGKTFKIVKQEAVSAGVRRFKAVLE